MNESFSSAALFGREKNSHSPVCDSIFLGLSGQNFADMRSRPTKILKISAFRDFFVTESKCQKGAKNLVKNRFLRRISILCSSYVSLTQSGYFLQNSMAGVNPCRNGHSTKSMRHKNPKNTDFLSIVYTLRALLSISFSHFLCVGHHLFVLLGVSKAICKGKRLRFSYRSRFVSIALRSVVRPSPHPGIRPESVFCYRR